MSFFSRQQLFYFFLIRYGNLRNRLLQANTSAYRVQTSLIRRRLISSSRYDMSANSRAVGGGVQNHSSHQSKCIAILWETGSFSLDHSNLF